MAWKRPKYGNRKVVFNGIKFDSERERDRWIILKAAEENGIITDLQRQVTFELIPKVTEPVIRHFKRIPDRIEQKFVQDSITYRCDFQYRKGGVLVVEDCKISPDMIPQEYRLREKLFRWKFGFSIRRIYDAKDSI